MAGSSPSAHGRRALEEAPLQHLRVLEIGGAVAVRYCGRLFARLGAEVTRIAGGMADDQLGYGGASGRAYAAWLDDGKAPVDSPGDGPFDLVIGGQTAGEVASAARLAADLAGKPTALGLTWFDHRGPYADWSANDPIIHALTGASFSFGLPEGPPMLAQGHSPQVVAGLTGFIAALAALMNLDRRPSRIDVNVFEAAMCFTEVAAVVGPAAALSPRLGVNRFAPTYPASVYESADGYVGITALTPPQWAALCRIMARPDLAADPRFATSLERLANSEEIDAVLIPFARTLSTNEWVDRGDRLRVPITPVPTPGEMPDVPHWRDRGSFAHIGGDPAAPRGPTLPFRMAWDGETSPRPAGGEKGPLDGVRVADFSMGWAGPLAGRYLGDLGADVLKVESKVKPDWWRGWEVIEDADPPPTELMPNFMCVNRNKRGLDIDLTAPAGIARARKLMAACDVVLENLGPGVMDRLGLPRAGGAAHCAPGRDLRRHAAIRQGWTLGWHPRLWIHRRTCLRHAVRQWRCRLAAVPAARGLWRPGGGPVRRRGGPHRAARPRAPGRRRHRALPGRMPVPAGRGRRHRRAGDGRPAAAHRQPPRDGVRLLCSPLRGRGGLAGCCGG